MQYLNYCFTSRLVTLVELDVIKTIKMVNITINLKLLLASIYYFFCVWNERRMKN